MLKDRTYERRSVYKTSGNSPLFFFKAHNVSLYIDRDNSIFNVKITVKHYTEEILQIIY